MQINLTRTLRKRLALATLAMGILTAPERSVAADNFTRTSVYVPVRDGVKIAVDYYVPTGRVGQRYPVIITTQRYMRAWEAAGSITTPVTASRENIYRNLLAHGYAVVLTDIRGSGASQGVQMGLGAIDEARDAFDVMGWIAGQPWARCDFGMVGRSYMGSSQYFAASAGHPCLKAIFPQVNVFDSYDVFFPGGIYRPNVGTMLRKVMQADVGKDSFGRGLPAPVDDDDKGVERDEAILKHRSAPDRLARMFDSFEAAASLAYRDKLYNRYFVDGAIHTGEINLPFLLHAINRSKVAIYQFSGWRDGWTQGSLDWFMNLKTNRKLIIGPWTHSPNEGDAAEEESLRVEKAESLRWFDHWLKGIRNGIEKEPAVRYALPDTSGSWTWRSASSWPDPVAHSRTFFLSASEKGGILSVNANGFAPAHFNPSNVTSMGVHTRVADSIGLGPLDYSGLTANDRESWTFTSNPVTEVIDVSGYPQLIVPMIASQSDFDVIVYLSSIDASGRTIYMTEGALRASHRQAAKSPYQIGGIPWQRSYQRDVIGARSMTSSSPANVLHISLLPTAFRVRKGERIRVSIMFADRGNRATLPPPTHVSIVRNKDELPRLELPILRATP